MIITGALLGSVVHGTYQGRRSSVGKNRADTKMCYKLATQDVV